MSTAVGPQGAATRPQPRFAGGRAGYGGGRGGGSGRIRGSGSGGGNNGGRGGGSGRGGGRRRNRRGRNRNANRVDFADQAMIPLSEAPEEVQERNRLLAEQKFEDLPPQDTHV